MSESSFWNETELSLLPDEHILYTLKPNRSAIFKSSMLASSLVCLCFGPFIVLIFPLLWWINGVHAKRHQGFVTNQRVIVTNGLIGYSTRSVPLERISDVQIGCSWAERYFNIRSIMIRDMTGEAQGGARMEGLEDIQGVQDLILREVRRVNRQGTELLSIASASPQKPALSESGEVVELLREIRDTLTHRSTQ